MKQSMKQGQASQESYYICSIEESEITSSMPMIIQLVEVARLSGHLLSLRGSWTVRMLRNIYNHSTWEAE
jgi:hypothetical protein